MTGIPCARCSQVMQREKSGSGCRARKQEREREHGEERRVVEETE